MVRAWMGEDHEQDHIQRKSHRIKPRRVGISERRRRRRSIRARKRARRNTRTTDQPPRSVSALWTNLRNIMSKTNDTSRELTNDELGAVSGAVAYQGQSSIQAYAFWPAGSPPGP